jgi:6-phosphogluconolactonase
MIDCEQGRLTEPTLLTELSNPGFLQVRDGILYSNGNPGCDGDQCCTVASFRIDETSGQLIRQASQTVDKLRFCHISLAANGRVLLGADYHHGKVAAFPLGSDGAIGKVAGMLVYAGASGVNPERQMEPHVHSVTPAVVGNFMFVCDFSADAVRVYKTAFEDENYELELCNSIFIKPGAGPRHLVCHPGGKLVYVINELSSSITAFAFDAGELDVIDEVSTLPEDYSGENTAAEIALSPGARFLYASNRGHDSIVYYRVDSSSGQLELQGIVAAQGAHPRNFIISPSGKYMIVSNRDSDSVALFKIDRESGRPVYTGSQISLAMPMGLAMDA